VLKTYGTSLLKLKVPVVNLMENEVDESVSREVL
jgi:hypothetical protein